ncbi:Wadjet anti-phage system protein JetD domain-containing protein [Uliginosibacterium sp. sgz301328]|uniref:Wadjet anti-phage system protein JetD domain-containing protein n=1 Tax=Uliginosibacterium sp. sgz301328 TaxID=3243764 RepID=UPI00359F08A2
MAIEVLDPEELARCVEVIPRWQTMRQAMDAFGPSIEAYPVLNEVLNAWVSGASPRKIELSSHGIESWLDAVKLVSYCKTRISGLDRSPNAAIDDIPIRRVGAQLFNDSKRPERLAPAIDALVQESLILPPLEQEDVFRELGLVKFPLPFMISAPDFLVRTQLHLLPAIQPYLALHPGSILGFELDGSCAGQTSLLSVENLTTFHELASSVVRSNAVGRTCLLYTGGMPSPSWMRVYKLLLSSLPRDTAIFHWGDIDSGGFRIADHLSKACCDLHRTLHLHAMAEDAGIVMRNMLDAEIQRILGICERRGWFKEADFVKHQAAAIEQESLPLRWPSPLATQTEALEQAEDG